MNYPTGVRCLDLGRKTHDLDGLAMIAVLSPDDGFVLKARVIRDITDEKWNTTPRLPDERVYEVRYLEGSIAGQYSSFAARHLSP